MKYLYIIGNGFDIFTGLNTSYRDFRKWLEIHYPFVYEDLVSAYGIQDKDWWNDFEVSLGELNIRKYVRRFTSPERSEEEIMKAVRGRQSRNTPPNIPPSLSYDPPCADRLAGLLDVLGDCMRKWILSLSSNFGVRYVHLEKKNSLFLSFNYTRVLELLYKIPKENILHIHGDAYHDEKLVFGHNTSIMVRSLQMMKRKRGIF